MPPSKCPVCGCETFFCKNPNDEYETTPFSIVDGLPSPVGSAPGEDAPDMTMDTETYCDRCSWHKPLKDILKRGAPGAP